MALREGATKDHPYVPMGRAPPPLVCSPDNARRPSGKDLIRDATSITAASCVQQRGVESAHPGGMTHSFYLNKLNTSTWTPAGASRNPLRGIRSYRWPKEDA
ncbi:hypothetical protein ZWY2020_042052 [Hordeum vulgare]|nr:hypothetical protein ZWY2020_042052 [Hordeum vulgare]